MSTYWIVGETETRLKRLRAGMVKVKGRQVTYGEVIEELMEIAHADLVERGWLQNDD